MIFGNLAAKGGDVHGEVVDSTGNVVVQRVDLAFGVRAYFKFNVGELHDGAEGIHQKRIKGLSRNVCW